jgi:hypothetical protein
MPVVSPSPVRTTRAVQTIVEHALQGKAIQPQVLVAREMFVKYVRKMLMHRYG